jgi:hypothetical protein
VVEELRHSRTNGKGQVAAADYANGAAVIRG